MKSPSSLLASALPVLLLATFYICRLGFNMRDANIAGMLMIMSGAVLSVATPTVIVLSGFILKRRFWLGPSFAVSSFAGCAYWLVSYLDIGDELHQFIAA